MNTVNKSGYMPTRTGKIFQSKLESLKSESNWTGMVRMLKRYAMRYPNEYYIYQQLAATLYCNSVSQFKLAYKYAERAMIIEPDDDLNIYTYACALYYVGQLDKSLEYFTKIINKDIHEIAYGKHGEGVRYAKQLINDSVYMTGVVCQDMHRYNEAKDYFTGVVCQDMHRYNEAKDYFMRYLESKKPFQYSDFTKKQAMNHLSELTNK